MRKFGFVLLGLMVLGLSLGAFGYRWFYEPQQQGRVYGAPKSQTRSLPADRSGAPSRSANTPSKGGQTTTTATTATDSWHLFEVALNAMNVVVGLLGMWMTMVGMRMQQAFTNNQNGGRRGQ